MRQMDSDETVVCHKKTDHGGTLVGLHLLLWSCVYESQGAVPGEQFNVVCSKAPQRNAVEDDNGNSQRRSECASNFSAND